MSDEYSKICAAPKCRQRIVWVRSFTKNDSPGYWCNEHTTNRHLCPTFDPEKHFKIDTSPLRKTTIEARLELIEKQLMQIKELIIKRNAS